MKGKDRRVPDNKIKSDILPEVGISNLISDDVKASPSSAGANIHPTLPVRVLWNDLMELDLNVDGG